MKSSAKQIDNHENRSWTVPESELFRELVAHLRLKRALLREDWAQRVHNAQLLTAMTSEESLRETTAIYDNYARASETGSVTALQAYARALTPRRGRRACPTP